MESVEKDLHELIVKGQSQGYLTYDEVNAYLPDEDVSPEKLDNLIIALEEMGVELVNEAPKEETPQTPAPSAAEVQHKHEHELASIWVDEQQRKLTSDPIRMYLSQMAEIPLLTRDEEISLAKKIEVSRKRFRRAVLGCDYALRTTVDTLRRVHQGELPFDRTIKVSLTEQLTKEQILARMPHNLKTLDALIDSNRLDFSRLIRKSTTAKERRGLRRDFIRRRRKCLQLVEELSLRTRRIQPLMAQLEAFADRMEHIRSLLRAPGKDRISQSERTNLRRELKDLMSVTQEIPRGLRH